MTQMFTGQTFDNTKTADEWYSDAWTSDTAQRIWYDRAIDNNYPAVRIARSATLSRSYNVYYAYEYTGDTSVLKKMSSELKPTAIFPMKEYFG